MFKYSENRKERRKMIHGIAEINPGAGAILAAVDFEWTLNRCILVLGKSPTVTLRDSLLCPKNKVIETQKTLWKQEIKSQALTTLFDKWAKEHGLHTIAWSDIKTSMSCRNQLVHSVRSIDDNTAKIVTDVLETACDILCKFAESRKKDIYGRLHPRPRLKSEDKSKRTLDKTTRVNSQLKSLVQKYIKLGEKRHE